MTAAGSFDTALLVVALGVVVWLFARSSARRAEVGRPLPPWRTWAFVAGLTVLVVALASPLHAAAATRFSAHMVQHVLLTSVAAPLLVAARPHLWSGAPPSVRARWRTSGAARVAQRCSARVTSPPVGAVLLLTVLTLWHLPVLYEAALANAVVHQVEHATMFGAALAFWTGLATAVRTHHHGPAVVSLVVAAMGMTALAALLTFSGVPWYPAHVEHAAALGFDALGDQQVAGLVMWTPKKVVLLGVLLVVVHDLLRRPAREVFA